MIKEFAKMLNLDTYQERSCYSYG